MNYQTFERIAENAISDVWAWVSNDPINGLYIVAGIAVLGAINGIRLSFNRCKGPYNGRIL